MAGPSSSRRPVMNVCAKSAAMREFVRTVIHARRPVIPIVVGSNMIEVNTLVGQLMRQRQLNGTVVTIDPKNPKLFPLDEPGIKVIVFMDARKIPETFQERVMQHQMDQKVVIAIFRKLNAQYPPAEWHPNFPSMCIPPTHWPTWEQRTEDHRELIERTYAQMGMTVQPLPELNRSAMNYLLTNQRITGVDDVEAILKRGLRIYRKRLLSQGSLRDVHLNFGRDPFPEKTLAQQSSAAQPASE